MIKVEIGHSSVGIVLVALSEAGVRAVQIGDDADALARELTQRFPDEDFTAFTKNTSEPTDQVLRAIESPGTKADVHLDLRGSPFQKSVWHALGQIPAGTTVSYSELAARVGNPGAVRAVAHACATNAIAVIVPCHRVVRSDGSLAGYRWGIDRKRILLEREAAAGATARVCCTAAPQA